MPNDKTEFTKFLEKVREFAPKAEWEFDDYDRIVIHTEMKVTKDGKMVRP